MEVIYQRDGDGGLFVWLCRETQKKPPARPTAAKPSLKPKSSDLNAAIEDPELAQLSAAILALGGDLPEELRSLPPDMAAFSGARLPGPDNLVGPAASLGGSSSLPWPGAAPPVGLARFPANLPPPELLARIAQFPATLQGPLHRGPVPQIPPQLPAQSTLPGYQGPPPQPRPVAPTPLGPSTTTVDSIQAPIPSFAPTSHQPVPPMPPSGYPVPPQMAAYPHFMPQPRMPVQGPAQPQKQPPQQYPQPSGHQLPHGYQPGPRAAVGTQPPLQTQQGYPHGPMPPQHGGPPQYQQAFAAHLQPHQQNGFQPRPAIPQGFQPPQGYMGQQPPQMLPRPPHMGNPPIPPASQPAPPASQAYLPHTRQQTPTGLPQHMLSQQPQMPMAPGAQQMPPHPHVHIAGGPRAPVPPTSQGMPLVSQNYPSPTNQHIPPTLHPQIPPASQPHMVPGPQPHLQRPPLQMPPGVLPPQQHPHSNMPPQPMRMPTQAQSPHSAAVCYPGAPVIPQQPLVPQPAAPHPPAMYPPALPAGAPQQAPILGPHIPPTQHILQPSPGPSPSAVPPSPSPSPSPAPSPGPASLGLAPQQRATPAAAPPSLSSPSTASPPTPLFQHQNSSTDDLLSSSPEGQPGGAKAPTNVLQPTKADPQDRERRQKGTQGVLVIQGDPYQAPERVARLHSELERYRARVGSLEEPSAKEGGLSLLDVLWKELQEQQEKDARQLSIAIARCYSMKNRHQDVMPYDVNRVVLQSGKDDYINASFVEELSPYCPRLIATQAPLSGTAADFWLMVYEQKVSLVVMLVSEQELDKVLLTVFLS